MPPLSPSGCAPDHAAVIRTPVGVLGIRLAADRLVGIDMLPEGVGRHRASAAAVIAIVAALRRFFRDPHVAFDLPLGLSGTAFQRRVWAFLQTIPVGRTVTYASLANSLSSSARAVGQACRANPIPIIVPCHRVVAARGLGGFMGGSCEYLHVKRWLIQHEAQASPSRTLAVTHRSAVD